MNIDHGYGSLAQLFASELKILDISHQLNLTLQRNFECLKYSPTY